jgi:tRNA threonylcarbamoyladenosine modification (KEOPS) complex  Pcc1 subunit
LRRPKAEAEVSLPFNKKSDAEALRRALSPETARPKTSRASVRVTRRKKVLRISFFAKDFVALRAMLNSYLRMAATWKRVSEALDGEHEDRAS